MLSSGCFLRFFIVFLGVLVATAYSTLLERKLLAGAQRRKGPNKVSWKGVAQPLADALKLLSKERVVPSRATKSVFFWAPCFALCASLSTWVVLPFYKSSIYHFSFIVPVYFCLTSLHVFGVIFAGWASNSMYAMLGTLRAIAQTISYELPLVLIVLGLCFQLKTFSFFEFKLSGMPPFFFLWSEFPVFYIWTILTVAELHRAPFDLPEAESELVSGYNTDYGATGFILLFIAEYAGVVFAGQIMSVLWLHWFWWPMKVIFGCLFSGFIFLLRAVLPRMRYNGLMEVCWKSFLPFILLWFLFLFLLSWVT